MSRPYFSVVLDNYNYGRFIGQALDSVLAQKFPMSEVEIIVVDDGSTDDSVEVVGRYGDRVKLIRQKNQGQAATMSRGLQEARGEIACLLDTDDYWHDEKLSAVADALKDPAVGLVQHMQREVDIGGHALSHALAEWPMFYTIADVVSRNIEYGATSSLAFRTELLKKVLPIPKDIFYFSDVYLLDTCLLESKMRNIPRVLGYHRLHGANNWAKTYHDPRKIRGSVEEASRYRAYLEPKLKAKGLPWSHGHFALQENELARRAVLLAAHEGRRLDALKLLPDVYRRSGGGGFGLFRAATCLLAAISPKLYLHVYEFYNARPALGRMRAAVAEKRHS